MTMGKNVSSSADRISVVVFALKQIVFSLPSFSLFCALAFATFPFPLPVFALSGGEDPLS